MGSRVDIQQAYILYTEEGKTLKEIAGIYKVTKERIRQIVTQKHGNSPMVYAHCFKCDKIIRRTIKKRVSFLRDGKIYCYHCFKKRKVPIEKVCKWCGNVRISKINMQRDLCSPCTYIYTYYCTSERDRQLAYYQNRYPRKRFTKRVYVRKDHP